MKLVDLNVLLNVVNDDAAFHRRALAWWEHALNAEEPVGLAWIVALGFLRITTNSSVFPRPLSAEQAVSRVDAWLSAQNLRLVLESEDHWSILRSLLSRSGMAGNLTTDAHLASIAISRGATLVSADSDFGRFVPHGLRWENPFA